MEPIILASSSPRRQEILKTLNIPFIVMPADIDETIPSDIPLEKASEYLASKKVQEVLKQIGKDQEVAWILGADTTTILDGKLYGKPKDIVEAEEFLRSFQGRTQTVITSLALYNGAIHDLTTRVSVNKVTFAPMNDQEIEWYLNTGEWHGATGGFRIQGLASCFIKHMEGTVSSVVGLPIYELYDMLNEQNYSLLS